MSEHSIRLRGAWEWQDLSDASAIRRHQTLPIPWPEGLVGPVRLSRRFNSPPIDPRRESVTLRMEKVPGLLAVRLDGSAVEGPLDESLTLALGTFGQPAAKHVLILEVDPTQAACAGEAWGEIALVIEAPENDDEARSPRTP